MNESEQEYPLHQARQETHGHQDDEHDDDFLARTQPVLSVAHNRPLRQREEDRHARTSPQSLEKYCDRWPHRGRALLYREHHYCLCQYRELPTSSYVFRR